MLFNKTLRPGLEPLRNRGGLCSFYGHTSEIHKNEEVRRRVLNRCLYAGIIGTTKEQSGCRKGGGDAPETFCPNVQLYCSDRFSHLSLTAFYLFFLKFSFQNNGAPFRTDQSKNGIVIFGHNRNQKSVS